ncbi:MAG: hypothetical protein RJA19_1927 [Bacteroidota bacterium]|jgi:hypothetical protein
MRTLFPILLLVGIGLILTADAQAQFSKESIGLRGGIYAGITGKYFIFDDSEAIEGIVSFDDSALLVTGLYEFHRYDFATEALRWYYGAGATARLGGSDDLGGVLELGIDGIVGIEYLIGKIPLSVGLDYKPRLIFIGSNSFNGDDGALSLRYQF